MFESLLLAELTSLDSRKPVHVEGESRKIGQLQVPAALIEAMRASECVVLEAGLETRVRAADG
jgi:tRNA 2-selenouridine synthase